MTSQAKWFSFGAAVGLPVALLASQLHWVAGFNVAVAVVRAQWCYRSTVGEANALKASLPSIPNLQRIKAAQIIIFVNPACASRLATHVVEQDGR
jgi:hypothetical protein